MNTNKEECIEYHSKFDLDAWTEQAGTHNDDFWLKYGMWSLDDAGGFYAISPNIKGCAEMVDAYMADQPGDWVVLYESIRVFTEHQIDEWDGVMVFAAYELNESPLGYLVNVKYFGIVCSDLFIEGYSRKACGLTALGLHEAEALQSVSMVIGELELEGCLKGVVDVLGYNNLSLMMSESQEQALYKRYPDWDDFEDTPHKDMMLSITYLQNHLTKSGYGPCGNEYPYAYHLGSKLFGFSVCPELYHYKVYGRWHDGIPHSCFSSLELPAGEMVDLMDIEGRYLVGKPSEEVQQSIAARLASNNLPPEHSYDAEHGKPSEVNHYTYELLKAVAIESKAECGDDSTQAPVYIYAVEEKNNRYRGDSIEDQEAFNLSSVWLVAEQIDSAGNVLLSGEEAFASAGVNSDHLQYGYNSNSDWYKDEKWTVLKQVSEFYLRSTISHTQAMRVRMAAPRSVYGDKPVLAEPRVCYTKEEARTERRFEFFEMSAQQLSDYKVYSTALKACTHNKTKDYSICKAFIIIDNAPWQSDHLTEYSVVSQVFMPTVDEEGDKTTEEKILLERYECSADEGEPLLLSSGLAENEPQLQLNLSYWFGLCDNEYCPEEMSLSDETPMLSLYVLKVALDGLEQKDGCDADDSLRLKRQLKTYDLDSHFLALDIARRRRYQ